MTSEKRSPDGPNDSDRCATCGAPRGDHGPLDRERCIRISRAEADRVTADDQINPLEAIARADARWYAERGIAHEVPPTPKDRPSDPSCYACEVDEATSGQSASHGHKHTCGPDCPLNADCSLDPGHADLCMRDDGTVILVKRDPASAQRDAVPAEVHESGWQWRPVSSDTAFAPPFGTIRACSGCGCLVAGGPTRCGRCAERGAP